MNTVRILAFRLRHLKLSDATDDYYYKATDSYLLGPTATIQNSEPLVTSNKAREKYGLPLLKNPDGSPMRFDVLRPQRLAASVKVYIEQFGAHPSERCS